MSKARIILRAFFVSFVFAFAGALCFFLATGGVVGLKLSVLVVVLVIVLEKGGVFPAVIWNTTRTCVTQPGASLKKKPDWM